MQINFIPLSDLKPGESGIVKEFRTNGSLTGRLRELGLVTGTKVTVKRYAPFGDPLELVVRGYNLSLRKSDAAEILVSKETP